MMNSKVVLTRRGRRRRQRQSRLIATNRLTVRAFGLFPIRSFLRMQGYRCLSFSKPAEAMEVFRLRHEIYVSEKFAEPRADGLFRDAFDDWSENILLVQRGEPVASCRLILGSHPAFGGFWTESLFALRDLPEREQTAEVSRFGVVAAYRNRSNTALVALLIAVYEAALRYRFRYLVVNMPLSLARLLRKYNITAVPIPQDPPEASHLANRRLFAGYFEQKSLQPFTVDLDQVIEHFRLPPIPR